MSEITQLRSGQGTSHTTVPQSLLQFTPSQNETPNKDVCNPARVLGAVMNIFSAPTPSIPAGASCKRQNDKEHHYYDKFSISS